MSSLAPTLQAFFTQRLVGQRQASPHTIAAYRDTFRLLLGFASHKTGRSPAQLNLDDLDAPLIGAFLDNLETQRGNAVSPATSASPPCIPCSALLRSSTPSTLR